MCVLGDYDNTPGTGYSPGVILVKDLHLKPVGLQPREQILAGVVTRAKGGAARARWPVMVLLGTVLN
jgi:hypothetical protein